MLDFLALFFVLGAHAALSVLLLVYFVFSLKGIPFVPSKKERVLKMVALSGVKKGERILDLGSGDGRVVCAFAHAGAIAHGYEFNPLLVWLSRRLIRKNGFGNTAKVMRSNFWKADISSYDVVTIYGLPSILGMLEKKFERELKKGARVVSNAFPLPSWKPACVKDRIYYYEKP